jgi:predicted NUDIX family phosphoesterase
MNPNDSMESKEQYLIDELKRELYEEVKLLNGCLIEDIEFIGFINDDTISVSSVHIGLLYNIHVSNKDVYINETDKMTNTEPKQVFWFNSSSAKSQNCLKIIIPTS